MSYFLNFGFTNLTVFFICFSCCFSEDYNYDNLIDPDEKSDAVFRVIGGTPASLGDAPYQVRPSPQLYELLALIKRPFSKTHVPHAAPVVLFTLYQNLKPCFSY